MQSTIPRVRPDTLLIIGNGLNRAVDNSGSWGKLISTLLRKTGYDSVLGKPAKDLSVHTNFITLFQEISLHWLRKGGSDRDLKEMVAAAMADFEESVLHSCHLHEQLMALPCHHILTTNYDYVLEECAANDEPFGDSESENAETTFSLYRCTIFSRKQIWHIHGERSEPKSINLGHNQYAGYLHYARQYLIHGIDSSGRERTAPLATKLAERAEFEDDCWLDLLFSSRKIIWLGISLPASEYVLWWLIFYRAEMMQRHKLFFRGYEMHFIDVHATNELPDVCWQREERNRMLHTAGAFVHDRPVNGLGGWEEQYGSVIEKLGS